jgi:hypothetical protein
MAAEHHRKRVLFVVDYETDGYLVFKVNLKDLFSDDHTVPPPPPTEMEVLPLPGTPVASFQEPEVVRGNIAFAVSGTTIVGLGMKRTFTYDTSSKAAQSGPTTGGFKCGALLLPVGADVYAPTFTYVNRFQGRSAAGGKRGTGRCRWKGARRCTSRSWDGCWGSAPTGGACAPATWTPGRRW